MIKLLLILWRAIAYPHSGTRTRANQWKLKKSLPGNSAEREIISKRNDPVNAIVLNGTTTVLRG